MNKAWNQIKQAWEENPMQVIVIGALAATAAAKLLDASTSARNSRVWEKEVSRRIMMAGK